MFCPNCGAKNHKKATFCANCGASLKNEPIVHTIAETTDAYNDKNRSTKRAATTDSKRKKAKRLISAVAVILILVVAGGGYYFYQHSQLVESPSAASKATGKTSGHKKASTLKSKDSSESENQVSPNDSAATTSSTTSESAVSSSATSTAESSKSNAELTTDYLVGKKFKVEPILYDGEDANQAMEDGTAPTNLVHDYTAFIYFDNREKAEVKFIGQLRPDKEKYNVSDRLISIEGYKIPYKIKGTTLVLSHFKQGKEQQGVVTYRMIAASESE